MKKPLLCFCALSLVWFLAVPAYSQEAAPAETKQSKVKSPPAKFDFTVTLRDSLELNQALRNLELAKQAQSVGRLSQEELSVQNDIVELARRRVPVRFTLRSSGGTLNEFVKASASVGRTLSFTLINAGEPEDLEAHLPPFTLNNANWDTIIGVLQTFLTLRGLDLRTVGGDDPNGSAGPKSVVCVLRRIGPPTDPNGAHRTEFESFQIDDPLSKDQTLDIHLIVDAIRSAWELEPAHDPTALRIKFHSTSKLLFVSGPVPAAKIAGQVIASLRKKPVLN